MYILRTSYDTALKRHAVVLYTPNDEQWIGNKSSLAESLRFFFQAAVQLVVLGHCRGLNCGDFENIKINIGAGGGASSTTTTLS